MIVSHTDRHTDTKTDRMISEIVLQDDEEIYITCSRLQSSTHPALPVMVSNLLIPICTNSVPVIGEIFGHNRLRSSCLQVQPVTVDILRFSILELGVYSMNSS
jgi:hypothetical protein